MNESEARSILEAECAAAGERLLWWGRPSARRSALRALPASLFGLPFTAFSLFWMWGAAGGLGGARPEGPWLLFPLFGLPFLVVGLGMVLSPVFALRAAGRTLYAVTSGAVLVAKAGRSRRVERHPLPAEESVRRSQRADGSGDLDVARAEVTTSKGTRSRTVTFVGIPDVARVERILTDAARAWRDGLTSAPSAASPGPFQPPAQRDAAPAAPAIPAPRRTVGSPHGAPPHREVGTRRLPVLALLVIGFLGGFAVALGLVRAGRMPAGWIAPAPAPAAPVPPGTHRPPADAPSPDGSPVIPDRVRLPR